MSTKLDQSLDTIMGESKGARTGGRAAKRPQRRAASKAKAAIAPTGGIQKNTKPPRAATVVAPATASANGDSKIIVSNLPLDVTETLLKDFFAKAVGHVKKVLLSYGPNGRSRGEASVVFGKPDCAMKAFKEYNSVKVDDRPMRIEIVGASAPTTAAAKKSLQDRMPKPRSAAEKKDKTAAPKTASKPAADGAAKTARTGKKKSGRAGKPKAKTADELDAEMADYFGGDAPNGAAANGAVATNGAAPVTATNGGDMGMDEVS